MLKVNKKHIRLKGLYLLLFMMCSCVGDKLYERIPMISGRSTHNGREKDSHNLWGSR